MTTRKKATLRIEASDSKTHPFLVREGQYSRVFASRKEARDYVKWWTALTATPDWWIVTLRRTGDDEDSLYIVQAKDSQEAWRRADRLMRKDCDMPLRQNDDDESTITYRNFIVRCPGPRPEIVNTPIFG